MPRTPMPLFKRSVKNWIAVRPIRLSSRKTIEPGRIVPITAQHRLRILHLRRRIGPEGHPWTIQMLENVGTGSFPAHFSKSDAEIEEAVERGEDTRTHFVTDGGDTLPIDVKPGRDPTRAFWIVPGARSHDKLYKTKKEAQGWINEQREKSRE